MARKQRRPAATRKQELVLHRSHRARRSGWRLARCERFPRSKVCQLHLTIRRCHNRTCSRYHQPCRPEEEGSFALPHGEFGLDIIALIGTLRYERHQSVPEIHEKLVKRGVIIAERTVTN